MKGRKFASGVDDFPLNVMQDTGSASAAYSCITVYSKTRWSGGSKAAAVQWWPAGAF